MSNVQLPLIHIMYKHIISIIGNLLYITKNSCYKFKDLVENNKLSDILYTEDGKPRKEKIYQLAFYGIAEAYCEANNLDIIPEPNSGRGSVDFKMAKDYKNRILVEIKLTTNPQLFHSLVALYSPAMRNQ